MNENAGIFEIGNQIQKSESLKNFLNNSLNFLKLEIRFRSKKV